MIKFENTQTYGWEAAVRGARNPLQSWAKSDTHRVYDKELTNYDGNFDVKMYHYEIGPNDHELLLKLAKAGPDHGKALRMIGVTVDITAPLYWWKQADQFKVGTVTNSTSTMHTLHKRDLTVKDFSTEALTFIGWNHFTDLLSFLNQLREMYVETQEIEFWQSLIALLPSCYNQMRTWSGNYAVLRNIYKQRRNHKLQEWRGFCQWIELLPYAELITEA